MNNKQKAIQGGKWMTTSTVISTVFQFIQIAILARLLEPTDFGIVSVSTMLISFFSMFTNLGFNNSIIYKQEKNIGTLSSLYFLNLFLGLVIFIIVLSCAPFIADFYNEPRLKDIIRVASLFFLIVYFGQIYSILMQKELQFKKLALIDIVGSSIGIVTTITFAYSGFKEYSLIYGQLSMQVFKTLSQICLGRSLFMPKLHYKYLEIKEHLKFGVYNLGDGIVGFLQSNSDNFLIGSMLGVKALGYYTLASQLAVFPMTRLNPIVLQVAYPIIAKMKENASEVKKAYLKILDFLSYCNIPLLGGLYITSDSVVPLIYGAGWEPTISLIKILVLVSLFMCLAQPLFTLAFSKGKPNLLFYLNICTLVIKIPLIYFLGKMAQSSGVAWAFVISTFLNLTINFFLVHSMIGSFLLPFLKNILKTFLFTALMIICVYLYKTFIGSQGIIHLLMQIFIGGTVFISLTLSYKFTLSDIRELRKKS